MLPNAVLAIEVAPALIAVGYILGYRQSAVLVAGSLVSSLVLIPLITWFGAGLPAPLFPETVRPISAMGASDIWSRYVRYVGAGAVAVAGILTVAKNLPTMGRAFAGCRARSAPPRSRIGNRRIGGSCHQSRSAGIFRPGAIALVIAPRRSCRGSSRET